MPGISQWNNKAFLVEFISKWCGEKEKQDKEVNRMSDGVKC